MLIRDGRPSRPPGLADPADTVTWEKSHIPEGWLPCDVDASSIRWIRTSSDVTSEPSFRRWLNRVRAAVPPPLEFETERTDLKEGVAHLPDVEPAGMICHVTRCGSTLLSNALSSLGNVRILSEVDWLDSMMLETTSPSEYRARRATDSLPDVTKVLAYYRSLIAPPLVIKCGFAGIIERKGIRSLWPHCRWVMMIRNPLEVVVSNVQRPPATLLAWYRGLTKCPFDSAPAEVIAAGFPEFAAWVVGQICHDALAQLDHQCLVLDYTDVAVGFVIAIARHCRLPVPIDPAAALRKVFCVHSKRPDEPFLDDTLVKREGASAEIRDAVKRWAEQPYLSLLHSAFRCAVG